MSGKQFGTAIGIDSATVYQGGFKIQITRETNRALVSYYLEIAVQEGNENEKEKEKENDNDQLPQPQSTE